MRQTWAARLSQIRLSGDGSMAVALFDRHRVGLGEFVSLGGPPMVFEIDLLTCRLWLVAPRSPELLELVFQLGWWTSDAPWRAGRECAQAQRMSTRQRNHYVREAEVGLGRSLGVQPNRPSAIQFAEPHRLSKYTLRIIDDPSPTAWRWF